MNGIEFPDPYGESELLQRLGIATDMCYTILESPEQAPNTKNRRFFIFVPQLEFLMFQTVDVQKCNGSTRHQLSTNGSDRLSEAPLVAFPGGVCWLAS